MPETYTLDDFPQMNELVREYLRYCVRYYARAGVETKFDDEDWIREYFHHETTNETVKNPHFDIEWYREEYYDGELEIQQTKGFIDTIKTINEYLTDNYGEESILDWRKYEWTYIIHHFAYAYAEWLITNNREELCEDLKETERKYKQDEIALREAEVEKPIDPAEDYTCVVCLETKNPHRLHPDLIDGDLHEAEDEAKKCDWCKSGVWCYSCDELIRKGGKVKCPVCRQKNPKPKTPPVVSPIIVEA
jgi:hypothetical protein